MEKTEVKGIYKVGEGVLINKDNEGLKAYKMRKKREAKVVQMEKDLDQMKSDIQEIKELLKGLVK